MEKLKIVVLDGSFITSIDKLKVFEKYGELSIYEKTYDKQVEERVEYADIIITSKVKLGTNLQNAKKLKLICLTATGTNNIDFEYINNNNIKVTNVAGYSTSSVAQHTFAMLFYVLERLGYYDNYVKSEEYQKSDGFTHIGRTFWELEGKTWGIMGLGNIGKKVASIAKGFGCKVVFYSTSGRNNSIDFEKVSLNKLMSESDIISIHSPLNDSTENLVNYDLLSKMKKSAIILNVGRGKIINEFDLAKILDENRIFGAGLDVLENEPILEGNPLLKINNLEKLLITPHIAWATDESRDRLIREVDLNIESFLNGTKRNIVN